MEMFEIVSGQVFTMFLLICTGFICVKARLLDEKSLRSLSRLLLTVVMPCVMVMSFQQDYSAELVRELAINLIAAVATMGGSILLGTLMLRGRKDEPARVMRFAIGYSNCGFFGIPLLTAAYGQKGAFCAVAFVLVYNVFSWTHGLLLLQGKKREKFTFRTLLELICKPGVLGALLALGLFFLQIRLPERVASTVTLIGNTNTPLAMIAVGGFLAQTDFRELLGDKRIYYSAAGRLLIAPLLTMLACALLQVPSDTALCAIMMASLPTAAALTLQSAYCGIDESLPARTVSLITLISLLTIPLISYISTFFFS